MMRLEPIKLRAPVILGINARAASCFSPKIQGDSISVSFMAIWKDAARSKEETTTLAKFAHEYFSPLWKVLSRLLFFSDTQQDGISDNFMLIPPVPWSY
jgi:hypothetical protein